MEAWNGQVARVSEPISAAGITVRTGDSTRAGREFGKTPVAAVAVSRVRGAHTLEYVQQALPQAAASTVVSGLQQAAARPGASEETRRASRRPELPANRRVRGRSFCLVVISTPQQSRTAILFME